MSRCIMALDQGTTSSRAVVFDESARVVHVAQREFDQHYPSPGQVEHDAKQILDTQLAVAREAAQAASNAGHELLGIGITNQRETCVLWDRSTGEPLHRAIVWQDRRTAPVCEALRADGKESLLRERSGLLLDPYFSASKLAWMLDEVPGARERAEAGELAFGTIDSWLIWHLSEGRAHVTDASNASRTALFNIHQHNWDPDLLALWKVPAQVLPDVVASSDSVAETTLISDQAIPIAGIAGDQQAALFGQACFEAGMAKCTYGTGCFILTHTGSRVADSKSRLLSSIAWTIDGVTEYCLEGSVFMGGAIVQWLRDGLGIIEASPEVETLAASVPDSDGVILLPAFTGLGAPHWQADARAALFGMTRGTSQGHIARAALEAIAMQVTEVCEAMVSDTATPLSEMRVDGGACANNLLMQLQCDLLGHNLLRPALGESTAWGAAALAGLGVGLWSDRSELAKLWQLERAFEPQALTPALEALRAHWPQAVARAAPWSSSA